MLLSQQLVLNVSIVNVAVTATRFTQLVASNQSFRAMCSATRCLLYTFASMPLSAAFCFQSGTNLASRLSRLRRLDGVRLDDLLCPWLLPPMPPLFWLSFCSFSAWRMRASSSKRAWSSILLLNLLAGQRLNLPFGQLSFLLLSFCPLIWQTVSHYQRVYQPYPGIHHRLTMDYPYKY